MPQAKVWILSPVAPHNLNMRPLVIPDGSSLQVSFCAREDSLRLSLDNRYYLLDAGAKIQVSKAPFMLKRVRLDGSNFFGALTDKLHWGDDLRNSKDN
jgi:NAD+ kinase